MPIAFITSMKLSAAAVTSTSTWPAAGAVLVYGRKPRPSQRPVPSGLSRNGCAGTGPRRRDGGLLLLAAHDPADVAVGAAQDDLVLGVGDEQLAGALLRPSVGAGTDVDEGGGEFGVLAAHAAEAPVEGGARVGRVVGGDGLGAVGDDERPGRHGKRGDRLDGPGEREQPGALRLQAPVGAGCEEDQAGGASAAAQGGGEVGALGREDLGGGTGGGERGGEEPAPARGVGDDPVSGGAVGGLGGLGGPEGEAVQPRRVDALGGRRLDGLEGEPGHAEQRLGVLVVADQVEGAVGVADGVREEHGDVPVARQRVVDAPDGGGDDGGVAGQQRQGELERRVPEGRVQFAGADAGEAAVREPHLGERLAFGDGEGAHALERRAVVEASFAAGRVEGVRLDVLGALRAAGEGGQVGGGGAADTGGGVPRPAVGPGGERAEGEAGGGGAVLAPDGADADRLVGEGEVAAEADRLQGPRVLTGTGAGGGHGERQHRGAGQHDGVVDLVVAEPRQLVQGELGTALVDVLLGGGRRELEGEPAGSAAAAHGVGQPVAGALEGVRGHGGARAGRERGEGGEALDVGAGERLREVAEGALLAAEAAEDGDRLRTGGDELLHGRGEHRVGADLDDVGDARVEELAHGVGEEHRLPQVGGPVRRVELGAVEFAADDRGHQRDGAAPGADRREGLDQLVGELVHVVAVRGVVHVDQAAEGAVGLQEFAEHEDGVGVAGEHAGRGSVVDGERDGVLEAVEGLLGALNVEVDGEHPAAARGALGERAADRDDPRPVLVREVSGDGRGRHLALAVADDDVGLDAGGAPHLGDADGHGPQGGLDLVVLVEPLVAGGAGEDGRRVPGDVRGERLGTAPYGLGEDLRPRVQVLAHAGPLGALAGQDEGDLAALLGAPGEGAGQLGLGLLGERPQPVDEFGGVLGDDGGAGGEVVALLAEGGEEADGRVGVVRVLGEDVEEVGGALPQRGVVVAGEREQQRARLGGGRGRGGRGRAEHDVGVGAAPAEGVDAREPGVLVGECGRLGGDLEVQLVERDVRVELVHVEGARDGAVLEGEDRLDDAREAGRRLQVADVRLGRADEERAGFGAARGAQRGAQRLGLDRVAAQGAGAVGLDVREAVDVHPGLGVDAAEQLGLGLDVRGDEAVAATVVVDGAVDDDAVDPVAVREGLVEPLEVEADGALAADEAVGLGGERPAVAVGREAAEVGEADGHVRHQDQVDAADEGAVEVAGAQGRDGEVQGDEAGGAARLDDEAGAAEAEEVREPGGDDVEAVADGGVLGREDPALLAGQLVVVPEGADVHAGAGAADLGGGDARVLQGLPADLQHEALLRVELLGLARGDAEEAGVELVDAVDESGDAGNLLDGVELRGGVPALGRYGAYRLLPRGQELPVAVDVGGAGELSGHADDGDEPLRVLVGGQISHGRPPGGPWRRCVRAWGPSWRRRGRRGRSRGAR
ncbi:hypothetical protein SNARM312S_03235 [Streptomyces narbonensis]